MSFPKIKRAIRYRVKDTILNDYKGHSGERVFKAKGIKTERLSRAKWAKALVRELEEMPVGNILSSRIRRRITTELLRVAEADEK